MKEKKSYIIPSADVQSLETEGLIASSPDVWNISDDPTGDDAKMSRRHKIWDNSYRGE